MKSEKVDPDHVKLSLAFLVLVLTVAVYYAFTCHLQIGWVFHKLTEEPVWNLVTTSWIKSKSTVVEKLWLFGITLIDCNRNPIIKLNHKYLQDTKEERHIKMTFTICPIQTQCDYNLSTQTAAQCDTLTATMNIFYF